MTTPNLDDQLTGILADLEKLAETPAGGVQAGYIINAVESLAKLHADETRRPQAEAILQKWASGEHGELRKRIASHWMDRASGIITAPNTPGTATADPNVRVEHSKGGGRTVKTHPLIAAYRARVTTGRTYIP